MPLILLIILLLSLFLRVFKVESVPLGFTPDEASFGYDAYSILLTGRDQWGKFFPLVLESFGDFKAPLYAYISIPFIAAFGLSQFAVRFPNALVGVLSVYATYMLVYETKKYLRLSFETKKPLSKSCIWNVETIVAFMLAISPWHIMMSRGAFEANLTTLLLPAGLFLFFAGINKRSTYRLILSAILLGVNLFSYHSAKLVTPVLLIFIVYIFRNELLKLQKRQITLFGGVFLIFLLLTAYTFFLGAFSRAKDVNITNGSLIEAFNEREKLISSGMNKDVARIISNKYTITAKRFFGNYSQYFSYQFFISRGPSETTYGMVPGIGISNYLELILIAGFIVYVIKAGGKLAFFVLIAILVTPIPAALSTGPGFAANRAVIMNPFLQIAYGIGMYYLVFAIKNTFKRNYLFVAFLTLEILFCGCSLAKYFLLQPLEGAKGMLYGRLEAVTAIDNNNDEVVMDTSLSEPHIYVAFAKKINPYIYQDEVKTWNYRKQGVNWVDQMKLYKMLNFTFKDIKQDDYKEYKYLLGLPSDFSDRQKVMKISTQYGQDMVFVAEGEK